MIANLFVLAAVLGCTLAHPTKYPNQPEIDCHGTPPVLSYHTHITYMLGDSEQIDRAMALRDRTIEHFNPLLGEDCDGEMDD